MLARRLLVLVFTSLALAACRSTSDDASSRATLPFHLAIASFDARLDANDPGPEDGIPLKLDGPQTARGLAALLDGKHFAKTTLLPATPKTSPPVSIVQRNEQCVEAARRAGADLLMTCDLEYAPRAKTETNDKFWLNLPLFLLGGPATWFVNDRDYEPEARLVFHVYDLGAIDAAASGSADPLGRDVVLVEREAVDSRRTTMDFIERAGSSGQWYFVSIFWPSGFLVPKSDAASEHLGNTVVEGLCAATATQLRAREAELLRPLSASFFLASGSSARRRPDGKVDLSAKIFLTSIEVENLGSCNVYAGSSGKPVASIALDEKVFDEDQSRGTNPVYRYDVATTVDVPGGAKLVRLEIKDSGTPQRVRYFTLPVE
jgi:hypothetical protein